MFRINGQLEQDPFGEEYFGGTNEEREELTPPSVGERIEEVQSVTKEQLADLERDLRFM